jgi:hypothetical protein
MQWWLVAPLCVVGFFNRGEMRLASKLFIDKLLYVY